MIDREELEEVKTRLDKFLDLDKYADECMKRTHPGEQDVSIGSVPLSCSLSNNSLPSSMSAYRRPRSHIQAVLPELH